jgi:hypothetical protein
MYCQYYVAFFDKAGTLIGCAAQGTGDKGLAAGEKTHLGSCLVFLPAGCHEKVIQYKVAYYESDQEIGKGTASKNKKAKGNFVIHFGPGDENKEKAAEPKPMPPSHFDNPAAVAGKPSPPATARAVWYSAGPDWRELNEVVSAHGITLVSGNHEASLYRKWLADTRPGSVLVLLIALNKGDYDIPEQYRDLLPVPWDQIEASLQKGQNVVRLGKARNRTVFLFAAPTENVLKRLIHKNQLLLKLADK